MDEVKNHASDHQRVILSDPLRYGILRELDLESKLSGFIEVEKSLSSGRPKYIVPTGDLPPGTRSQFATYRIKANGWKLVRTHRYVTSDGTPITDEDPLYIRIDDVTFVREKDYVDRSGFIRHA